MIIAKKEYKLTPEPADTEFRKEFPPDPIIGSELDEAARVWRVYRKEAESFDKALLQGWSETLDILLIFAGLFSAVATAFVIESYQFLQLDNSAYAAAALYILVAASNHSTGITLPPPPDLAYGSSLSRWINGLWFTSILLSLAVALLSILAKQWITEYRARNNASAKNPRDWARRREVYFQALNSWPVAEVITLLPVLLHLSLFLFFAGAIAFLWTLDRSIGIWIIFLGGFLGVFYMACTLIPLWLPQCPTATPLAMQLRTGVPRLVSSCLKVCLSTFYLIQSVRFIVSQLARNLASTRTFAALMRVLAPLTECRRIAVRYIYRLRHGPPRFDVVDIDMPVMPPYWRRPKPVHPPTFSQRLEHAINHAQSMGADKYGIQHLMENSDDLDACALSWLVVEVSDSDAVAVGIQALGAVRWDTQLAYLLRSCDPIAYFTEDTAFTRSASDRTSTERLRVLRSMFCMSRQVNRGWVDSDLEFLSRPEPELYPDLVMLAEVAKGSVDIASRAVVWKEASPSLQSTALHALRYQFARRPSPFLFCCDIRTFSDASWYLALETVAHDFHAQDRNSADVPDFARPFRIAVIILESRDTYVWADQLLYLVLRYLRSPPRDVRNPNYNLLPPTTLKALSSKRFLDLTLDKRILDCLGSYFRFEVDAALRDGTSMPEFWGALACLAASNPSSLAVMVTSRHALFICINTKQLRSTVLDAFLLLPRVAAAVSNSLWTMFGKTVTTRREWMWIEIGEVLAACLCASVRDGQETERLDDWIERFFADLLDDAIALHARWADPYTLPYGGPGKEDQRLGQGIIHLFQHCAELRPQWFSELLRRVQQYHGPSTSTYVHLVHMHEEASRRGFCQSCPEHLGYGIGVTR